MNEARRRQNERKFGTSEELRGGGRRNWYEVLGHSGWRARYVKAVDANEETTRFCQEIHDERGRLVEVHEKYPVDLGHQLVARSTEEREQ